VTPWAQRGGGGISGRRVRIRILILNKKNGETLPSSTTKFQPGTNVNGVRAISGGTRPLAAAPSVSNVLGMMVVHLSRKIIYGVDISHKVGVIQLHKTIAMSTIFIVSVRSAYT
jgi:hypothetical protein